MTRRLLYFSILFSLFFVSACHKYEITPISEWKQLNDFPGEARASATSFSWQEKAFIGLGRAGLKENFLKDFWEYNIQTDQWTRKSDFPGEPRVKAIGAVVGDKAYIGLGGIAPYTGPIYNDLWEYDLKSDNWKQVASFPGKASNDLFYAVIDGCIYTTEGYTNTQFKPDTYKYDPKTNEWTRLRDCPVKRSGTAGFAIGKNLYVGTGYDSERYKDFYCYHTETDTWSRVADLPAVRVLSKGLAINGQGYIMLGRYWNGSLNGGRLLSDVVRYDPETNKWSKCGDFPGGARQNVAAFTINGKGYVIGGEDDFKRKSDVWVFQP